VVFISLAAGGVGYLIRQELSAGLHLLQWHPKLVSVCNIVVVGLASGGLYIALARLVGAEEVGYALKVIRRRSQGG
jgi:hypothetical protein